LSNLNVYTVCGQLGDARVKGAEGEEGLVTEPRENPALGDLHGDFDLRFVPRFRRPRRQDGGAVVLGELLVRALRAGFVSTGEDDVALERSHTTALVTPLKKAKARAWLAIQLGTCWVRVAWA
jgi:hypothetical protein